MSRSPDVDLVLREYLADDGASAPDYVLDTVADRIGRQPRRRTRRLRRRPFMNSYAKLAAGLAAVLVIGIFGWQLLPRSGGSGGTPTPSPTLAPASSIASSSPGSSPVAITPFVHAVNFGVPLTLTLSGGWTLGGDSLNNLELLHGGSQGTDLGFHRISRVTLPGPTEADPWIPMPADFIAWAKARPEWVLGEARAITVGGRIGTSIDGEFVWTTDRPARDFLRYEPGAAWLYDQGDKGHRIRFIIVPGPSGDGVIIVMNAPDADFDAASGALDTILGTVKFDAPTPSPS